MLNNALDYGISEFDFWSMTPGELNRLVESKDRVHKLEAQEKAKFDYIHASLIGRAVSTVLSSGAKFPQIEEVYPSLFNINQKKEEEKQQVLDQLSALRFKQFAQSYNKKFEGVAKDK